MDRRYVMAAAFLGIAACAAPGPESPAPVARTAEQASNSGATQSEAEATVAETTPVPAAPAARQAQPATESETAEAEPVLEVAEIPNVVATDSPASFNASARPEKVCRREMRTGSHRATRVCRTRAEIERLATEGRDTFEDLHRSQTEYE